MIILFILMNRTATYSNVDIYSWMKKEIEIEKNNHFRFEQNLILEAQTIKRDIPSLLFHLET